MGMIEASVPARTKGETNVFTTDAHCDTLYSLAVSHETDDLMITPERLRAGDVGIQTFAMFAGSKGPADHPYEKAVAMLAAAKKYPVPFYAKELPQCPPDAPHGVLSIEGGEILEGKLSRLAEFDDDVRIRLIALTWNNENEIGYPAADGPDGHLKPFGIELLGEMDRRGILADVSHLNEAGFWDIVEHMQLPPVASHSNCRALCDVFRNLTDDQIKAVIEKKGFIGINFFSAFLAEDRPATLDDVLAHIDRIASLGGIDVIGFGSDYDGISRWPAGLGDPSTFPALLELLAKHGYTQEQIAKIAGLNYWRVLKQAEAARQKN